MGTPNAGAETPVSSLRTPTLVARFPHVGSESMSCRIRRWYRRWAASDPRSREISYNRDRTGMKHARWIAASRHGSFSPVPTQVAASECFDRDLKMRTTRNITLMIMLLSACGGPALAATCNLTIVGANILDDASCTVTLRRGVTEVQVEDGSTIAIRRSIMSARLLKDQFPTRRKGPGSTSFGQVVKSVDAADKTCFFNYKAVLCVEP